MSLSTESESLIETLNGRTDELANQAYEVFSRHLTSARSWPSEQRTTFVEQAKGRFTAVLAVVGEGTEIDNALRADLERVGADAAVARSSLPHLLLIFGISRDLLLQTAMRLASDRKGEWDVALEHFSMRLPLAVDRLVNALSQGYWQKRLQQAEQKSALLTNLVMRIPYGIYEADLDGVIRFANPHLAHLAGRDGEDLIGISIAELFRSVHGGVPIDALLAQSQDDVGQVSFTIHDKDGNSNVVDIDTVVRRRDGVVIGFCGIARIASAATAQPDLSVLERHISEIHHSLDILAEAGTFINKHGSQMTADQIEKSGESIHQQVERIVDIVHELDDDRRSLQSPI